MLKSIKILEVSITTESEDKILEHILSGLKSSSKKLFVTTPNPEILVYANSHLDYKDKLNSSEASLPDGVGLLWAAKMLGVPLSSRISGVDFMERLCRDTKEKPVSIGFLGGKSGVAEKAANRLKQKYPWINVVFIGEEESDIFSAQGPVRPFPPDSARPDHRDLRAVGVASRPATPRAVPLNKDFSIDILFVAFGHPKQEEWIYENLPKIPVRVAMGVGGAFDYFSGEVRRAPVWIRKIGLEWFFRLVNQPWRFKRQLALITFIFLILREKFIKTQK